MLRRIGRGVLILIAGLAAFLALAPRESAGPLPEAFVPERETPEATVATLMNAETLIGDIREGAAKEVIWAREDKARTPLSLIYVHGFSATKAEIRPAPDRIAEALGANLFYTRLAGHGRPGAALGAARADDWMRDMAEALAVGKALGERVIVMGTSTGASLAALAAGNLGDDPRIAGYVLVSPNFGVKAAGSGLLTLPMARWWLPAVLGPERSWTPQNEAHAAGWTTAYPTEALAPMAGVAADALMMPYDLISAPVLFAFSDEDEVVDPARTREVAERWGGIPTIAVMGPGEGGDPQSHVIAGDALSPAGTAPLVQAVLDWVEARELTRAPAAAPPVGPVDAAGETDGG